VILTTWKAEIGRIAVRGQPRQKVLETSSQPVGWAWWFTSVILATCESTNRKVVVQAGLGLSETYLKNNHCERNWRHGQMVEPLPSKSEDLSSTATTTKKTR
jgi:hypothetical protein